MNPNNYLPKDFKPKLTPTRETLDYRKLKTFPWNRRLAEKNVRDLIHQISRANLTHLRPIIVTKKHFILDGQHRHEALKRMKLPIVYAIMTNCPEQYEQEVVMILNATSRNWRPKEYVHTFTFNKNANYRKVGSFADYHGIPLESAKKLCSKVACKTHEFREGEYRYDNEEEAKKVMEMASALINHYSEAKLDRCLVGLRNLLYVEGFNPEIFISKIESYANKLHSCSNSENYANMFINEIYNKRLNVNDTIAYNRKKVQTALQTARKEYRESLNIL